MTTQSSQKGRKDEIQQQYHITFMEGREKAPEFTQTTGHRANHILYMRGHWRFYKIDRLEFKKKELVISISRIYSVKMR